MRANIEDVAFYTASYSISEGIFFNRLVHLIIGLFATVPSLVGLVQIVRGGRNRQLWEAMVMIVSLRALSPFFLECCTRSGNATEHTDDASLGSLAFSRLQNIRAIRWNSWA